MTIHPFRDLWLKALALVFAVMLWLSVSGEPIVERRLDVPLEFENVPVGLEVVGTPPDTVSVRVRGAASVVGRLDAGSVVARLDLADARPGERFFDMFADRIEVPTGIEVSSVVPASVTLLLERTGATRSVPTDPQVERQPSDGLADGRVTIAPVAVRTVVDVGALAGLPPGRYNLPVVVESIPGLAGAKVDPPAVRVGPGR